jgi:hypothetical protein
LVKQINLALEKTELDSSTLKSNIITAISSTDLSGLAGAKTTANSTSNKAAEANKGSKAAINSANVQKNLVQPQGVQPQGVQTPSPLDDLLTSLQELDLAIDETQRLANALEAVVDGVGDNPNQQAKSCVDSAITAAQTLPLKLDGDTAPSLVAGDHADVFITGGVKPYTVNLLGDAQKTLSQKILDPQPNLSTLRLTALDGAKPGSYVVEITDHTNSSTRAVPVTVHAAPEITVTTDQKSVRPKDTLVLHVKGGKSPYAVQTIDNPSPFSPAKEIKQNNETESILSEYVAENAASGDYTIQVKDDTGRTSKPFTVKIETK